MSGSTAIDGEWDHVIVGAGSAGCALAARLADAGRRVLLLEAGAPDTGRWIRIPLGVGKIIQDERYVWKFETEPEAATGNRRLYWPRGKLLGGSSSVNGMIWVRGDPNRYDEWAATGCPGWDWAAMEQVMRGMEDFPDGDPATRGRGGPLSIEVLLRNEPIVDAFIELAVAAGIPANADYNGTSHEGVCRLQVTTRRGERCSSAVGYLRPALARGNVRAETNAAVERILFDGKRATGVAFRRNGATTIAHAKRDVIIAAGAIQSPQILELSGVGDGGRLRGLGIAVVHDLPGVGENLQDHYHTRVTYRSRGVLSLNDLVKHPWLRGALPFLRYQMNGTGVFAGSSAMIHALARVSPDSPYPDTKIQPAPDQLTGSVERGCWLGRGSVLGSVDRLFSAVSGVPRIGARGDTRSVAASADRGELPGDAGGPRRGAARAADGAQDRRAGADEAVLRRGDTARSGDGGR